MMLLKPSRLERLLSKFTRRKTREKQARQKKAAEYIEWTRLRAKVFQRDKGRCRAFGTPVAFSSPDPKKLAHVHHVIYRSAGGSNELDNLILLSLPAHEMVHQMGTLDVTGDGNALVTFTLKNLETGKVIRVWEG
jgi:5-methylcytosine-specific restriction endonuclease McrA